MSPITLAIWAAGWMLATVAGPFGTFESLSVPIRAAYWFVISSSSIVIGFSAFAVAGSFVSSTRNISFNILGALLATFSIAPVVHLATVFAFSGPGSAPPFYDILCYVALVCFTVAGFRILLSKAGLLTSETGTSTESNDQVQSPEPDAPRLSRRLNLSADSAILRLTVDDHFVDVVTEHGVERLRMRFCDAVHEMDAVKGYCTHRSHWVAEAAISRVQRDQGRIYFELTNGDTVPVSRKYKPDLQAAGLL